MMLPRVDADSCLVLGAVSFALCFGWLLGAFLLGAWRRFQARRRLLAAAGARGEAPSIVDAQLHDRVIAFMTDASRRLTLGVQKPIVPAFLSEKAQGWFLHHGKKAGLLSGAATAEGLAETSLRLGCVCSVCCALFGACFSSELSVVGLLGGMAFGISLPFRAVLSRQRIRALSVEHELSEMLDVLVLALRSGLSFDRGFQLYCQHFSTPFSQSCEAARRAWTYGLDSRENALRDLADSYDSQQLERAVQSIVRSLRFGSSLADVMERLALDVRQSHRAHMQERVAKVPVKMMVPTGALILPAMLLLVLGPVLLELMLGF